MALKKRSLANHLELNSSFLSLDDAISEAYNVAVEIPGMKDSYFMIVADLLTAMAGDTDQICVGEMISLMQNTQLAIEENDFRILMQPRGLRVNKIVDIQEFLESKFFMNQKGYVRPAVMGKLYDLFHGEGNEGKLEVVLGGGIGWGKSYFSEMGTGYMLYLLSCYHSPQIEFGLAPGSSIYFIFQSIRLEQAKKVLFQQFGQRLKGSPYFSRYFPFNPGVASELRFPSQITLMPISSADTAALGLNVFGGVLDELNFMAKIEKGVRSKHTGEEEYDQADKLYTTIVRRMKSRFNVQGRVPGKVFLISSANYPDDFIDKKIKEHELAEAEGRSSSIFLVRMAQWEALPKDRLSEERFFVEVGDATRRSRMLKSRDEASDPASVIEVPMDYYDDFQRDLEAAIRDLAGVPIGGSNAFIRQREKIVEAAKRHDEMFETKQLFKVERVDLDDWEDRIEDLLSLDYLEMIEDSLTPFAAHVDLALTGDSCSVSVGHFGGFKHVGRSFDWDEEANKFVEVPPGEVPFIVVDGTLEIIPPRTDEIDSMLVADLLEVLAAKLNLQYVTADSFQSAALLRRMRRAKNKFGKRVRAIMLSVDTSMAPYSEVKQALRDDRIAYPNVEKLKKELRDLQIDPKRGKIDHPTGGSKDLADSVAGVTYVVVAMNSRRKGKHRFQQRVEDQETALVEGRPKSGRRRVH